VSALAAFHGAPHWAAGISGSAISLDQGQAQYGEADRPVIDTSASYTVSLWVKLSSVAGLQTFVSQSGSQSIAFALKKEKTDQLAFSVATADTTSSGTQTIDSDFAPTPGQWYLLTGVYDAARHEIRFYVDGTCLGSLPLVSSWKSLGNTEIGCDSVGGVPADFCSAAVDELRIYKRALTDSQVSRLYASDLKRFQPNTFTWTNPIYFQGDQRGDDVHDPEILNDGGVYYMVATLSPFANYTDRDQNKADYGSAPGIALYASRDLKVWKFENWLYKSSDIPETAPYKHQFWAPELHKINGRYYIIFGASNWIDAKYNVDGKMGYYQFVGVSDKVTGPYTHTTALKGPGVDTTLFQDDDGKTYVVWPWNEIHSIDLSQIDKDIVTVGPKISQTTTPEQFRANGHDWRSNAAVEGPFMIKHNGVYYSLYACNYGGVYATGVSTATSLSGPWTLDPRGGVFAGGHQAEFIGPDGNWWACDKHEHSSTSGWVSIDPITFGADGSLTVTQTNTPQSVTLSPLPGKGLVDLLAK
jgi:GH43 family beta-xylosidase